MRQLRGSRPFGQLLIEPGNLRNYFHPIKVVEIILNWIQVLNCTSLTSNISLSSKVLVVFDFTKTLLPFSANTAL